MTDLHAKVVRLEVSIGSEDAGRSLDELITAIRFALRRGTKVNAHNVTVHGSYYILDGQVCLPADYDPSTRDRKPGTYPPVWAGGPIRQEPPPSPLEEYDARHEFVQVAPTRTRERLPNGRRVRSDKGKRRTPAIKIVPANVEGT